MKKIEMHAKSKFSYDLDSTIDIETLLWNAKENKERGIVFVDKDSVFSCFRVVIYIVLSKFN